MEQKRTPSWRAVVYRQPTEAPLSPAWLRMSRSIIARDHRCKACGYEVERDLTVHHIIPRKNGGMDDPGNLIALCGRCHDEAECLGICTYEGFYRWLNGHPKMEDPERIDRKPVADDLNWRRWVYGGYARPPRAG